MPLIKSASKDARNENIHEMLKSYKAKGSIGKSKPKNFKKAVEQASAIAYDIQRKKGGK